MASLFSSRQDLNLIFSSLWTMFCDFLRTESLLFRAEKQLSVFGTKPFFSALGNIAFFPRAPVQLRIFLSLETLTYSPTLGDG